MRVGTLRLASSNPWVSSLETLYHADHTCCDEEPGASVDITGVVNRTELFTPLVWTIDMLQPTFEAAVERRCPAKAACSLCLRKLRLASGTMVRLLITVLNFTWHADVLTQHFIDRTWRMILPSSRWCHTRGLA